MLLMASRGRPANLRRFFDAYRATEASMPLTIRVDTDDPALPEYMALMAETTDISVRVIDGPRIGSGPSLNELFASEPDLPVYGILADDVVPMTKGWDRILAEACKGGIAYPDDGFQRANLPTHPFIDGDFARACGWLTLPACRHWYVDNGWKALGDALGRLVYVPDVVLDHRHPLAQKAPDDQIYADSIARSEEDADAFKRWHAEDFPMVAADVAGKLGIKIHAFRPSDVRLAICTPTHDFKPDALFNQSMFETKKLLQGWGLPFVEFYSHGGSHIGKARERVTWDAMHSRAWGGQGCTHILMIDADMEWPPELVMRLLAADLDYCAAVGFRKQDTPSPCCNFLPGPQEFHPVTEFLKVQAAGTAFVLLKRSVIDRMCAAYPRLKYNTGPNGPDEYALFLDLYPDEADGERLSEDFAFSARWRKMGGDVWVDPKAELGHVGRKVYRGRVADFFERAPRQEDVTMAPKLAEAAE